MEVGLVIRCFTESILILTAHSLATIKLCFQEIYRAVTKAFQWGCIPIDELGGISNVGMNEKTFRQQILSAEANTIASLREGLAPKEKCLNSLRIKTLTILLYQLAYLCQST